MNQLIDLILDYGQECEDRDASSSNTLEKIKSLLEQAEKDAARYPEGYDGGVQTGSAVHLYFDTQENANAWFSEFMDKVDTAMQSAKESQ